MHSIFIQFHCAHQFSIVFFVYRILKWRNYRLSMQADHYLLVCMHKISLRSAMFCRLLIHFWSFKALKIDISILLWKQLAEYLVRYQKKYFYGICTHNNAKVFQSFTPLKILNYLEKLTIAKWFFYNSVQMACFIIFEKLNL